MTLEDFVEQLLKKAKPQGYVPTKFMSMRRQYGTAQAIRRLVETSNPQSGFRRLQQLGMREWTLEAAVLRFPDTPGFTEKTVQYAKARLDGILDA